MATQSKIEWTDASWNPTVGCSIASPGCHNCYAAKMANRLRAMALAKIAAGKDPGRKRHYIDAVDDSGRWTGKLIPVPEALDDPLQWKKPRRVFVNSMSDLFHESVPNEFIASVFATMYECQWHTFQILTKRAERLRILESPMFPWAVALLAHERLKERDPIKYEYVSRGDIERDILSMWPLPNVWLGVSVEDQKRADERIPHLLKCPAAVRFLSCEPLLGPVDLTGIRFARENDIDTEQFRLDALRDEAWVTHTHIGQQSADNEPFHRGPALGSETNWVIVGGESGPGARPCQIEWIESIVRQCKDAGVACFVKQLGSKPTTTDDVADWRTGWPEGSCVDVKGGVVVLKDKKGGDMNEWPEDLRVRQFPTEARNAK